MDQRKLMDNANTITDMAKVKIESVIECWVGGLTILLTMMKYFCTSYYT